MVRVISDICKIRDLLNSGKDNFIASRSCMYDQLTEKLRQLIRTKINDKNYEMDITAQDLRELSMDIKAVLRKWNGLFDAKNQTSWLLSKVDTNGKLVVQEYTDKVIPYLRARFRLTALLNVSDYFSVLLYAIEMADVDEFAIKHTERVKATRQTLDSLDSVFNYI